MRELLDAWFDYALQMQLWVFAQDHEKPKRPEYIKLDGKEWWPIKRVISTGTGKITVTLRSVGLDREERDYTIQGGK